ncbi:MAG: antitoxin [Alkaliphilus sp.]|nr:MAG: antitoxin [Alkaliphilus sp.]
MNNRDYRILIKIVNEINVINTLIHDYDLEKFMSDERTKRAVAMTLINVGELVKNLTLELRQTYPNIPWKAISGMRDLAAHKYQTLNMGNVWITVTNDIPELKCKLELILHKSYPQ